MTAKPAGKLSIDHRGWALATWIVPGRAGVDPGSLHGAQERHVQSMLSLGWIDHKDGLLFLNEAGLKAVADLKPEGMPKLTTVQREFLEDVIDRAGLSCDIGYPPALRLLAYGAVDATPQSLSGGFRLVATEMAVRWDAARADAKAEESPASPGMR